MAENFEYVLIAVLCIFGAFAAAMAYAKLQTRGMDVVHDEPAK
jgi:hypothetical protein